MPAPIILAGLVASIIGVRENLSAKETNERAQWIVESSKEIYDDAEAAYENAKSIARVSLLEYGHQKEHILGSSLKRFLEVYDKIKSVRLNGAVPDDISKFIVGAKDIVELQNVSDIYLSVLAGGTAGAVIGFAANGVVPVVMGEISIAGTAMILGEIGTIGSLTTSTLFAATPIATIVAPVLLFSALSSKTKAEENLEKAEAMYRQVEVAVEKMRLWEEIYRAIKECTDMFSRLLKELDMMFSECTNLLENLVYRKTTRGYENRIDTDSLSKDEKALVAVTRALAGAVKTVIYTPIINTDGTVSHKAEIKLTGIKKDSVPKFKSVIDNIEAIEEKKKLPSDIRNKFGDMDSLINHMIDNRNSIKILKDDVTILETGFTKEFSKSWRKIYYILQEKAPEAIFEILKRDKLGTYWLGDFTEVDVYFNIKYNLCTVEDIKKILLGKGLSVARTNTHNEWVVLEKSSITVMMLYISPGVKVKDADDCSPWKAKTSDQINAKFVKLNGLRYCCKNDGEQILYMVI